MNIFKKILATLNKNQKNKAIVLLILIFFSTILEILSIGIILPILHLLSKGKSYLIELAQNKGNLFLGFLEPLASIEYITLTIYIVLFLIGLFLFKFLFVLFTIWMNASFIAQIQNSLSKKMFNLYIKQKYSFHMDNRSSKLLNNIISQIPAFSSHAILSTITVITEGLIFSSIFLMLFITEPLGTTIIFFTLGIICLIYFSIVKKPIRRWGKDRIKFQDIRVKQIQESLQGIREILMTWKQEFF